MEDAGEKKKEIIGEVEAVLDALPPEEKSRKQKTIEERLFGFANFMEAKVVLLYLAKQGEVETLDIIKRALEGGKMVVLPVFNRESSKTTLYKVENSPEDLIDGPDGCLTPDPSRCKTVPINHIDIAIVPGQAFDEKGGRIGIGDKFYDKFVQKLPITTRKVAIAFEEQVISQVPTDSRNKHIDIIVTDSRTIYKI
ncbi:5-formyltetrahydrofolate cyclo-ligase [Desulfoluna spongiiphila]|uniref:5-formyltetrahydrofolate cyclo-ligase n=1 Tax=Desulfoluna spongiiphila TaxID=419481 RepID=A0A1G5I308_9BACT|nr:5-formyltetrahydrofolate cyclo-ligase [Desulfoluna spongiiphila]SCY70412.1 5-formyltetrahydrofolate cyclo-ligase [Desulfoluna spongiiphila]VVS92682.1 5-formyltetrahydrofolate cyclo-ligase [Desulfoluna spongiiphila]